MPGTLLYGGSFDPIHHGHLIIARAVAERLDARVLIIPCATPPHKQHKQLAPAEHRLEMCRRAVADDPQFDVSDWEVRAGGTSFTLRTVEHFAMLPEHAPLYWLIGMDTLRELHTWYRVEQIVQHCTFVSARRPGSDIPDLENSPLADRLDAIARQRLTDHIFDTPEIDISATAIRTRVRERRSVRYLVPVTVADYITQHNLYTAET